jgi:steroid 5-alpha reductase family enzyme
MGALEMLGSGVALALGLMVLLWVGYLVTRKAAIVDIGWTVTIGVLGLFYFYHSSKQLSHWLLICVIVLWTVRLTALLAGRMFLGQEDRRYEELNRKWNGDLGWKYFVFYQFQGLAAALLSVPLALAMSGEPVTWVALLGTIIFAISIAGEHVADQTMKEFRADPANKGKVCKKGLWGYSRHPNYFFEWLNWSAFAIFAISVPFGWIGLLSPALMLFFVLKVTGVPPTEEMLIKTRGDAYRQYQQEVSTFVPWFSKRVK